MYVATEDAECLPLDFKNKGTNPEQLHGMLQQAMGLPQKQSIVWNSVQNQGSAIVQKLLDPIKRFEIIGRDFGYYETTVTGAGLYAKAVLKQARAQDVGFAKEGDKVDDEISYHREQLEIKQGKKHDIDKARVVFSQLTVGITEGLVQVKVIGDLMNEQEIPQHEAELSKIEKKTWKKWLSRIQEAGLISGIPGKRIKKMCKNCKN